MGKFNTPTSRSAHVTSPVRTTAKQPDTHTYEGGAGYTRDARSELFVLGVSLMANEARNSFYEDARDRDERFASLVANLAVSPAHSDRTWVKDFLVWLRTEANIRTAALLGAVEFVHAQSLAGPHMHTGLARYVVRGVAQRADEPGELLAIAAQRHGRNFPMALKRGVADAATRLYTQRSWMKWDGKRNGFTFADVLQLTHPRPGDETQEALFRHILNVRYDPNPVIVPGDLFAIRARQKMEDTPVEERVLETTQFSKAGMTWENVAGWLQRPLRADEWGKLIPTMGYMALLRNLRNMEQAGISWQAADQIIARLQDPEEVARSRQLPMRFLSAYRAVQGLNFSGALERALDLSLANVPALEGNTLILVDRSGSMFSRTSSQTELTYADSAALFGTALFQRSNQNGQEATLVEFGSSSRDLRLLRGEALLTSVRDRFSEMGGTNTAEAIRKHLVTTGPYRHTRVVLVTDEQAFPSEFGFGFGRSRYSVDDLVPDNVPMYTHNLVGYRTGHAPSGGRNRHTFAGLSDASFKLIPLLEAGESANWPWLHE